MRLCAYCPVDSSSYILELQGVLVLEFALVQTTKLVDLVLVLAPDLDLFADGLLLFFRELRRRPRVSADFLNTEKESSTCMLVAYHSSLHRECDVMCKTRETCVEGRSLGLSFEPRSHKGWRVGSLSPEEIPGDTQTDFAAGTVRGHRVRRYSKTVPL